MLKNIVGKGEVKKFCKLLENQVITFENVTGKNHHRVILTMKNRDGKIITLPIITISGSPSDKNWKQIKCRDINKLCREHNIEPIKKIR